MRIATWNVNSARARTDRIVDWLSRSDVDVVALQETKCHDDQFPTERFTDLGYQVAHHGFSQWNGVAVLSRVGLDDVTVGFPDQPGWGDPPAVEARALGATCGGVRIWSLYIPNGRELGDPHLDYKLDWLDRLRAAGTSWLTDNPQAQIMLVGDWNVAPRDEDVWDMAAFDGATHVSPDERAAFTAVVDSGYTDLVRPYTANQFTYWDYQRLRFPKKQGMRIDFILGSPAVVARVNGAMIDREERKGKGASDHAPVIVDLN